MYYLSINKNHISILSGKATKETESYIAPIDAVVAAILEAKSLNKNLFKVQTRLFSFSTRFSSKLITWANEEYKTLSKCEICWSCLSGDRSDNFCSEICKSQKSKDEADRLNDNEESEFYC